MISKVGLAGSKLPGMLTAMRVSSCFHSLTASAAANARETSIKQAIIATGRDRVRMFRLYYVPMATLTYRTAGESHGRAMLALVEGMPAGVPVDSEFIDHELRRRQGGYGRGGRQKIETDKVEFLSGVRMNRTIASPI